MFSALFSFLGGSVFRMIWGEVAAFMNKKQDHQHETELLRLQSDIDDATHKRTVEQLTLQTTLGIKTIEAQQVLATEQGAADAFTEAMKNAFKPTGILWVDAWNGIIRPLAATMVLVLWALKLGQQGFAMQDYDMEISGVVLGFFFADRGLAKRGK